MEREVFIEIMDNAIDRIKTNSTEFSCVAIENNELGLVKAFQSTRVRQSYNEFYNNFNGATVCMLLNTNYDNKKSVKYAKNVRLAALELYKQITLDTGAYKRL